MVGKVIVRDIIYWLFIVMGDNCVGNILKVCYVIVLIDFVDIIGL